MTTFSLAFCLVFLLRGLVSLSVRLYLNFPKVVDVLDFVDAVFDFYDACC